MELPLKSSILALFLAASAGAQTAQVSGTIQPPNIVINVPCQQQPPPPSKGKSYNLVECPLTITPPPIKLSITAPVSLSGAHGTYLCTGVATTVTNGQTTTTADCTMTQVKP